VRPNGKSIQYGAVKIFRLAQGMCSSTGKPGFAKTFSFYFIAPGFIDACRYPTGNRDQNFAVDSSNEKMAMPTSQTILCKKF
jgi:hypothetical protein